MRSERCAENSLIASRAKWLLACMGLGHSTRIVLQTSCSTTYTSAKLSTSAALPCLGGRRYHGSGPITRYSIKPPFVRYAAEPTAGCAPTLPIPSCSSVCDSASPHQRHSWIHGRTCRQLNLTPMQLSLSSQLSETVQRPISRIATSLAPATMTSAREFKDLSFEGFQPMQFPCRSLPITVISQQTGLCCV